MPRSRFATHLRPTPQLPAVMTRPAPVALELSRAGAIQITALPAVVNLSLYAGDDFWLDLTVTDAAGDPVDLEAATVDAHIRATTEAMLAGEFVPAVADNIITLHLTSPVSAALPARAVWDCQLTREDGTVVTLAAGSIQMTADVTRLSDPVAR